VSNSLNLDTHKHRQRQKWKSSLWQYMVYGERRVLSAELSFLFS